MFYGASYFNSSKSELINPGPVLLTGVVVDSPTANDYIIIYDGMEDKTGRRVADFASPTAVPYNHSFSVPIHFDRGLYVKIVGTPNDYTVFYIPVREDPPGVPDQKSMPGY